MAFLVPPSASEIRLPSLASGFCGLAGLVVFGAVVVAGFADDATPVDELVPVEESSVEDDALGRRALGGRGALGRVEVSVEVDGVRGLGLDLGSCRLGARLRRRCAADELAVGLTAFSTFLTTPSTAAAAAVAAPLKAAADGRLSEIDVEM